MPSRRSIANGEDWGEQPALFDTSVEIFRYLVVISPSQEMIIEVTRLKEELGQAIGTFLGERSVAHITLLYAYLPIGYERYLIDGIQRAARSAPAFTIHFSGIHQLQDNSTIFIDPIEKIPIIALRKAIRNGLQSNKALNRLGIHSTSKPMLTIARKLPADQMAKAMKALAPHIFERTEWVTEVILLRGGLKEGEKYVVVGRFGLG